MSGLKEKLKTYVDYFNFTRAEKRAVLFLTVIFLIGGGIRLIKISQGSEKFFDNSVTDAKFENVSRNLNSHNNGIPGDTSLSEEVLSTDTNVLSETDKIILEEKINTAEDSLSVSLGKDKKKNKKEAALNGIVININTASKEELIKLPGIGESMAEKVIQYRNEHNGFKKSEDIMKVKGIGKKKFEKLKPYITVN